jgi:hypothetical protein
MIVLFCIGMPGKFIQTFLILMQTSYFQGDIAEKTRAKKKFKKTCHEVCKIDSGWMYLCSPKRGALKRQGLQKDFSSLFLSFRSNSDQK